MINNEGKVVGNITIEGARIFFRNFSGLEGKFNAKGKRNFCVAIDEDLARDLEEEGWNVKYLEPRDDGDERLPYIQVSVMFGKGVPPKVVIITSRGKTTLTEDEINILDWAEITNADLIIRPYNWEVSGKTGVKAYLKSLFVTISEDELEQKYSDIPDSAQNAMIDVD